MVCVAALIGGVVLLALPLFQPKQMGHAMIWTNLNAQPASVAVCVFNSAGKQIQQVASDQYGVARLGQLPEGQYTLKFQDFQGRAYPAVELIDVGPRKKSFVKVEIGQQAPVRQPIAGP
jgi:hypothetical protein